MKGRRARPRTVSIASVEMDDLTVLRERLAEISDLGRAAGVLGWDQRVTMPPLGTESRAESLATLGRIIHERFTDPEIGRLLERLAPLEESLPYDSDEASLIRVTRRDWEKAVPRPGRAPGRDDAGRRPRASRMGRGAQERRLRLLPALPADERRAEAPLHRVLRPGGRAVHGAARRLRAGYDDDRGARGVRDPPTRSDRARTRPHRRSTRRSCTGRSTPPTSGDSPSASSRRSASRRAPGASTRPPIPSAPRSRTGTCG